MPRHRCLRMANGRVIILCMWLMLLAAAPVLLGQDMPVDAHAGHNHAASANSSFFEHLMKVYTPRRVCMFYEAPVIWLHFIADLLTAIAYYGIAFALGYFIWRRKDLAFSWMFWLFSAFILACGTTHLFGVLDLWYPLYKVDGLIKLATGLLSIGTAIAMWPLIPQALAIPSPAQLSARIEERTAQLAETNKALRAALEAAQQARSSAEEANKAKDHFLAVLSHEMRTPLAPVLATVALLQERADLDPQTQEHLEVVRRNVEMEARLIDDLLDVTRIAQGKILLDRTPIDVCTIIDRTVEVCRPDIEARQLHVSIDCGDRPHRVEADIARLQQVFWNLLKNAVKFTPQGGCVGVRCSRQGDHHVLVEVDDSGIGIEPEVIPRLFRPFEQGERGMSRQFGGLGLGLTISKALVELHGGTISAHSEGRHRGASFRVLLPLVHHEEPASTQPPGERAEAHVRPLQILLVEDHVDTSRIMRQLLATRGHQVQTATDIASAFTLATTDEFDLLISDLGLPDGSGWDLMTRLSAAGCRIPALAMSGYGTAADIQKSREAGFDEHLTKPVDLSSLLAAVSRLAKVDR